MTAEVLLKTCPKCGLLKPLTSAHWHRHKSRTWQTYCRSCRSKAKPRPIAPDGFKVCRICRQTLALTSFYPHAGCHLGTRPECKECFGRETKARGSYATRKQILQLKAEVNKTLYLSGMVVIPPEKHCPGCRVVKPANAFRHDPRREDGLRAYCRSCGYQKSREWKKKHNWKPSSAARRSMNNNRRSRILSAQGRFSPEDVRQKRKLQQDKCFYCYRELKGGGDVEHKIPLSRGGSNWPANICLSCRKCNLDKGTKLPKEWRPERFSQSRNQTCSRPLSLPRLSPDRSP